MNRIQSITDHLQKFGKRFTHSKAITISKLGVPHEVASIQTVPLKPLGPSSVLLRMIAAPINPADINMIQGVYPVRPKIDESYGAVVGSEGLAEVIAVGSKVKDVSQGDWVISTDFAFGTWQTHAMVEEKDVLKIPQLKNLSILQGSMLAVNLASAYRMLKDFVHLKPGDVIIQNGANSGVGQAVIQICKAWGVKTVNVVRDRPNLHELVDQLMEFGADEVIVEKDLRNPRLMKTFRSTYGPIHLALNCVCGKAGVDLARWLEKDSVYVTYGAMSMKPVEIPASLFIFKNLTLKGFWLNWWYKTHDKATQIAMFDELVKIPFKELHVQKVDFDSIQQQDLKELLSLQGQKRVILFS